jgi:hypothetical protein
VVVVNRGATGSDGSQTCIATGFNAEDAVIMTGTGENFIKFVVCNRVYIL